MYYGLGNRVSMIDHIDRMADGSFWLHTQNSVYRVEVLESNIAADAETTHFEPEADREPGGTVAGDQRLENRGQTDDLLG
jgi:hypothetical protein